MFGVTTAAVTKTRYKVVKAALDSISAYAAVIAERLREGTT
jgi:hypothetical protein